MNLDKFVSDEELEIHKNIDTVGSDAGLKMDKNLLSMLEKKEKIEKKLVPVYLTEETIMKLKGVGYKKGFSVANMLETVINELTKDLKVDKKAAELYDKAKGNRGKKKTEK